ncbi:hypothetical protein HRI_004623300 [Hibiscus trionum]|uniref:Uncharacterized protein n=1 Tax=Hibiscus trionum TaxID=183268 RepID=A0A9W7J7U6_HIBTR|nr:hypothetical protein HRI_004623300 [Hibiscus trionum]
MGSQKRHASAKETLANQKEGNTGYDLPKDLKPWQRFACESTRYIVPSDASSSSWLCYSYDSSDFVDTSLYITLKSERKDLTPALDTPDSTLTPIEVAVIPDDKAIESPEKVAHALLSKGYKPHYRVSAVRDYPIPIVPFNTTDSTGFKVLIYKMSDPKDPSEAQSDSEESCRKSSSKNPEIVPLQRSNRAVAVRDLLFPQESVQTPFSQYLVQSQLSDALEPTEESQCEAKESSKEVELELSVNAYGLVPGDSIIWMNNISLDSFGFSSED